MRTHFWRFDVAHRRFVWKKKLEAPHPDLIGNGQRRRRQGSSTRRIIGRGQRTNEATTWWVDARRAARRPSASDGHAGLKKCLRPHWVGFGFDKMFFAQATPAKKKEGPFGSLAIVKKKSTYVVPLFQRVTWIGRDSSNCDIRIHKADVLPQHCALQASLDGKTVIIFLFDVSNYNFSVF